MNVAQIGEAGAGSVKTVETVAPIPTPMETFRALAPQEDLKLIPLFTAPLTDSEARIKRLETSVQQLRDDFDTIMPTMVRMAVMEKSLQELVSQLRTLQGDAPERNVSADPDFMGPVQPKLVDMTDPSVAEPPSNITGAAEGPAERFGPPSPAEALIEPQAGGQNRLDIKRIRIGDHPDKTRIVLDVSGPVDFTAALESDGRHLIVTLPRDAHWAGATALQESRMISGYQYENGRFIFNLLSPAKILNQQTIPASNGENARLVIDLSV